jgi:hypothetical protein
MVIGVQVGPQTGNLAVVGFQAKEHLADFLQVNPSLKAALITKWKVFLLVWLKTNFFAKNKNLDDLLWVAHGVVTVCWLDKEDDVGQVHQAGVPAEISYNEIVWPDSVSGIFRLELLESVYGGPYIRTKRNTSLNPSLWAAWAIDRLQLVFHSRIGAFVRVVKPDGKIETLGMGAVTELVTSLLQQSAALDRKNFPLAEIRPNRVQEIIALIQGMSVIHSVSEAEGLQEFLKKGVHKVIGATITTEELWRGYLAFFQSRNDAGLYLECEFLRISPVRIREVFGKTCVHSIKRDGRPRRGYNNLALAVPAQPAELESAASAEITTPAH